MYMKFKSITMLALSFLILFFTICIPLHVEAAIDTNTYNLDLTWTNNQTIDDETGALISDSMSAATTGYYEILKATYQMKFNAELYDFLINTYFYDESFKYISGQTTLDYQALNKDVYVDITNIPSNAKYMRFSLLSSDTGADGWVMEHGCGNLTVSYSNVQSGSPVTPPENIDPGSSGTGNDGFGDYYENEEPDSSGLYGTKEYFGGNIQIGNNGSVLTFMDCVQVDTETFEYNGSNGVINDAGKKIKYRGSKSYYLRVTGLEAGYILQGQLGTYFNLNIPTMLSGNTYGTPAISFDFSGYGGEDISFASVVQSDGTGYSNNMIYLDFNNYIADKNYLYIPFTVTAEFYVIVPAEVSPQSQITMKFITTGDAVGECFEFSDLRDVKSYEGSVARGFTSVTNAINNFINYISHDFLSDIKSAISTQTGNLTNWMTQCTNSLLLQFDYYFESITDQNKENHDALVEQNQQIADDQAEQDREQHDELLNGFGGQHLGDAAFEIGDANTTYKEIEEDLLIQSFGIVEFYSSDLYDGSWIYYLGQSILYVSMWFANYWMMGGIFTIILSAIFSISIVFKILKVK